MPVFVYVFKTPVLLSSKPVLNTIVKIVTWKPMCNGRKEVLLETVILPLIILLSVSFKLESETSSLLFIQPCSACELNNIYLIAIKWMKLNVVIPFFL